MPSIRGDRALSGTMPERNRVNVVKSPSFSPIGEKEKNAIHTALAQRMVAIILNKNRMQANRPTWWNTRGLPTLSTPLITANSIMGVTTAVRNLLHSPKSGWVT